MQIWLKNHFPKYEVIALFDRDRDPIEVERSWMIRFDLMEEVGRRPFADHIIYSYIIGFRFKQVEFAQ